MMPTQQRILLFSLFLTNYILTAKGTPSRKEYDQETHHYLDHDIIKDCPRSFETHNMKNTEDKLRHDYLRVMDRVHTTNYLSDRAPGSFLDNQNNLFSVIPEGEFVLWGSPERGILELSAFNSDTIIEGTKWNGFVYSNRWRFVSPKNKDFRSIKKTMVLEGDRVAFVGPNFEVFAHFFLDSIGYIAYLREVMPLHMRFIFADVKGSTQRRLETIDPEFAKRVDWIQCQRARDCGFDVKIRNGNLLVLRPLSSLRHMDLLFKARKWILQKHPPKPKSLQERTIVYYTRNSKNAGHGRAMDLEQEAIMIDLLKHNMLRYGRTEKLVIFDGVMSMQDQIDLFQSANIVVGAHGGGLANLIFLLPVDSCSSRPKVLEFIPNSLTPDIQRGTLGKTYYNLYSSCPWAEYHHILYVPPSTEEVTYIDLGEFEDVLQYLLSD